MAAVKLREKSRQSFEINSCIAKRSGRGMNFYRNCPSKSDFLSIQKNSSLCLCYVDGMFKQMYVELRVR
jgi:hypothetical protein